jgi:hypothetical protein
VGRFAPPEQYWKIAVALVVLYYLAFQNWKTWKKHNMYQPVVPTKGDYLHDEVLKTIGWESRMNIGNHEIDVGELEPQMNVNEFFRNNGAFGITKKTKLPLYEEIFWTQTAFASMVFEATQMKHKHGDRVARRLVNQMMTELLAFEFQLSMKMQTNSLREIVMLDPSIVITMHIHTDGEQYLVVAVMVTSV